MQAIAEPRTSLPILSQVFLEARAPDRLELRATDLEIGLSRECPATVKAAGACTADARRWLS
jgi:DNA polymerase III sliding clamp (beta) subunit (PCNA family)